MIKNSDPHPQPPPISVSHVVKVGDGVVDLSELVIDDSNLYNFKMYTVTEVGNDTVNLKHDEEYMRVTFKELDMFYLIVYYDETGINKEQLNKGTDHE